MRAKFRLQKSALRLHYEVIQAVDEFEKNKLLVVAYKKSEIGDNRFLLFDKLELVREYWIPENWGVDLVGPALVDTVAPMPAFSREFPWILKAHKESIFLINLKNDYMKEFGETETACRSPQ